MKRKTLFLTGTALIAAGIMCLVKKVKPVKKEGEQEGNDPDKEDIVYPEEALSVDQVIDRLRKYSDPFGKIYPTYLEFRPLPQSFPEKYYLFCINTFYSQEVRISITSGANMGGLLFRDETLTFCGGGGRDYIKYPRFKMESYSDDPIEVSCLEEMMNETYCSGVDFGYASWVGGLNYYGDRGWYRSFEDKEENYRRRAKLGGPVEVRALVSETVFNKMKKLQGDFYDMPAKDFLDRLDSIFEEEIGRPRTKSEIGKWGD